MNAGGMNLKRRAFKAVIKDFQNILAQCIPIKRKRALKKNNTQNILGFITLTSWAMGLFIPCLQWLPL